VYARLMVRGIAQQCIPTQHVSEWIVQGVGGTNLKGWVVFVCSRKKVQIQWLRTKNFVLDPTR